MKKFIAKLSTGHFLSKQEMEEVIALLLSEESSVSEAQRAAILILLAQRRLSQDELNGAFAEVKKRSAIAQQQPIAAVDLCGTGGDGKNTFNISTAAAIVASAYGVPICKFGNRSASSLSGSSDIVRALEIPFSSNEDDVKSSIKKKRIAFLHAPDFYPVLASIANIRSDLAVPTIFNLLGPILNPFCPQYRVLGVRTEALVSLYRGILNTITKQYAIVHSYDGYDEISLTGRFCIVTKDQKEELVPADIGAPQLNPSDLNGGKTAAENAQILKEILSGANREELAHVIAANAGVAISLFNKKEEWHHGYTLALETIKSGKAKNKLDELTKHG